MNEQTKASDKPAAFVGVACSDLFSAVRPTGWIGKRLDAISGRKYRWNKYLRACRAIPKTSPVAGSTSWKKINARRGHLISKELAAARKNLKQYSRSEELQALQDVAGAVIAAHLIAQNFLLARLLRKLKAENARLEPQTPPKNQ